MKQLTGRIISVAEFKILNQCVQCGYADDIEEGSMCHACRGDKLPHCEICDILLRQGKYVFYTYDNKDEYRETSFNPLQNDIREFTYIKNYKDPIVNGLCMECTDWEKHMKHQCVKCGKDFNNSKEHYIASGNLCEECK